MDETPSEIPPARLPFDVEFFKRAEEFSSAALSAVPELHGIAIVPIWTTQPENVPAGLLRRRNTQPPYVSSLLALLKRLAAFNMEVHVDLANQFRMYDNYAAELSRQIKARQEELGQFTAPATTDAQPNV